jgi:hypothetical protein
MEHPGIHEESSHTRMKLANRVATFAAAAALATLAQTAAAATEMPTGGPPAEYINYLKMKPMQLMHMIDQDKEGFVDKEEFLKFHEELFERMDKDRDGKVGPEEWLGRPVQKSDK